MLHLGSKPLAIRSHLRTYLTSWIVLTPEIVFRPPGVIENDVSLTMVNKES